MLKKIIGLFFLICALIYTLVYTLEARKIETFYGSLEVEEPVLLELIDSASFQRLQAIHQYGVAYYTTHREEFTRYAHCLGVFALLRVKGFPLTEQIAGLLHDISHTVFSHVGDWIFGKATQLDFVHFCALPSGRNALMRNFNFRDGIFKPIPGIKITPEGIPIQNEGRKNVQRQAQEKSYQDTIHLSFLKKCGVEAILQKHGFTSEQVLPDLFPALECRRPNLCADRIDYNIQGAYFQGFITYEEALTLFDDMQFVNGIWVGNEQELIKKITRFPLFMTLNCWASAANHLTSCWLAEAILKAIAIGTLSHEDLHFGTDAAVWNKLLSDNDPFIQERMYRVQHAEDYYSLVDPSKADLIIKVKFHGVDPWIVTEQGMARLTALDPEFCAEYQAVKERAEQGWAVQFIHQRELQN